MPPPLLPVPHHRQAADHTCVPACVRMVLEYLGTPLDEGQVATAISTSIIGTRARDVVGVRSLGFDVHFGQGSFADLQAALNRGEAPIIFLWTGPLDYSDRDGPHAVVVVGVDGERVYIDDPGFDVAPKECSRQGFLAAWARTDHLWAVITRPATP